MPNYSYQNQNSSYGLDMSSDLVRTFAMMAGGLLLTAAVSWLTTVTGALNFLLASPMITILLFILQLGIGIGMSAAMRKASYGTLVTMFVVYAVTMGINLSPICYVYTDTQIFGAFLVCALYFVCLAFAGMMAKQDLSKIGTICLCGLVALIISQLVMMLFRTSMSVRLYSIIGLVLFTGITAWDMQNMKRTMSGLAGSGEYAKKFSVFFALQLYLDFINIFLYILQLFGGSSRNSR